MRRPFFWPALGLGAGTLVGKTFSLPAAFLFPFLLFLFPFLWVLRGRRSFLPLLALAFFALGILRIQHTLRFSSHHVRSFAQGEWGSLEGKVVSFPELKQKGRRKIYSFILKAENLVYQRRFFETVGTVQVFLFNPPDRVSYGSRVRLRGKLNLPRESRNPGEFNYRKFLAEQGIHAVFEAYGPHSLKILSPPPRGPEVLMAGLQSLRDHLSHQLEFLFPPPLSALLKALILGIRKDLPEELREDFIKTGTAHLIAISGMNITLVAGSAFLILICLGFPQKGAALGGLLGTIIYVFLSGAGIPVVRAGWMTSLFFTGLLLEREKDLLNTLFFAFFAILIVDPRALFQASFQLSFLSVFFLIQLSRRWDGREGADLFQTGIVLVGTFPLCVSYFSVFSWTSLFANLLAVPFFHLGVMGGMASLLIGKTPLLGSLAVRLSSLCLKMGLAWIHFWAEKSWGYFYLRPPSWPLILFYYTSLALAFFALRLEKRTLLRTFSFSLWLLAAAFFFIPPREERFLFTVLAAGQNEVFHAEFPGRRHWLVNAGRTAPSNQAKWILTPFLRKKGAKHLQGIIFTDSSSRHTGGLGTLMENFSVRSILFPALTPSPWRGSKRVKHFLEQPLFRGDKVPFDKEGGFEVLEVIEGKIFLMIDYQGKKFLFIPTWKSEVLRKALPRLKELSFVDVLIFPASPPSLPVSLGREILSEVLPHWVVFPGKPVREADFLETLKKEEIPFFFLSETGALCFEVRGGELSMTPFHSFLS